MRIKNITELFSQPETIALEWIENNKENIIPFAQSIESYNRQDSSKVEKKFFETIVQSHIMFRKEFIESPSLNGSLNTDFDNPDYEDYMTHFFKIFPKEYRDIFKKLDQELFENIMTKSVSLSYSNKKSPNPEGRREVYSLSPLNFIQFIYLEKSKANKKEEATEIYLDHNKEMNNPIINYCRKVEFKTDIFDHFLKRAGDDCDSWNFFAPLEPLFFSLNARLQQSFIAVAFSEIEEAIMSPDGNPNKARSLIYNQISVMESLRIVPLEILKEYANDINIDSEIKKSFEKFLNHMSLTNDLAEKPKNSSRIKI